MRLKQFAITLICGAAMMSPAFAQTTATVPTMPKMAAPTTPTMPATPTMPSKASILPGTATAATPMATSAAPTAAPAMGMLTNINTASPADLDKLPQIGKARAKKIILNRPYKSTDELVSKKVLTMPVFNKIKDKITAS